MKSRKLVLGRGTTRDFMFEGLTLILGDDGLALRDGFVASPAQRDYSQRFCEAICRADENRIDGEQAPASIMLASADTGTGKTAGYGIPLLLRASMGHKVAIATHSHALQRQFLGTEERPGDILRIARWVKEITGTNLKIARRIGRQAFISASAIENLEHRLREEREERKFTVKDLAMIEPLLDFAYRANEGKSSGLIEDIREQLGELPLGIMASSISLSSDSDVADLFAYQEHLTAAEAADVVIVSHTHIAACSLYRRGQILNSPIDSLVIDEADRLADVADSTFRFDLSLRRVASGLEMVGGAEGKRAHNAVNELANFVQSIYAEKRAMVLSELSPKAGARIAELAKIALQSISVAVKGLEKAGKLSRDAMDDLRRDEAVMGRFVVAAEPNNSSDGQGEGIFIPVLSYSPVHSLPSLSVMPINPGKLMSRLWNLSDVSGSDDKNSALNCVLLTSATLGAPGHYADPIERFRSFASELGIYTKSRRNQLVELDLWSNFEPEKFGAVRFILADPSISTPVADVDEDSRAVLDESWIAYAADMILCARRAGGRTLVLCNSYRDAESFAQLLQAKMPDSSARVIQQVRGQSTKDCEGDFLADANAIWLSPTAWEGLNLPGAITNLVIPRLPFTGPDYMERALISAYSNLSERSVDSILNAKRMNAVKRKLRQGLGRPIRSRNDKARIWIGDPRFPLHSQSQIPLRHPDTIRYSSAPRFPGMHVVIPYRFQRALEYAEVFAKSGELLK